MELSLENNFCRIFSLLRHQAVLISGGMAETTLEAAAMLSSICPGSAFRPSLHDHTVCRTVSCTVLAARLPVKKEVIDVRSQVRVSNRPSTALRMAVMIDRQHKPSDWCSASAASRRILKTWASKRRRSSRGRMLTIGLHPLERRVSSRYNAVDVGLVAVSSNNLTSRV